MRACFLEQHLPDHALCYNTSAGKRHGCVQGCRSAMSRCRRGAVRPRSMPLCGAQQYEGGQARLTCEWSLRRICRRTPLMVQVIRQPQHLQECDCLWVPLCSLRHSSLSQQGQAVGQTADGHQHASVDIHQAHELQIGHIRLMHYEKLSGRLAQDSRPPITQVHDLGRVTVVTCASNQSSSLQPHPLHLRVAGVIAACRGDEPLRHSRTTFPQHVLHERQVLGRRAAPVPSHACCQQQQVSLPTWSAPRCAVNTRHSAVGRGAAYQPCR